MKKYYQLLLTLTIGCATLSSCSRANYAFNPAGPSYLGATHARPAVVANTPEPALTASAETAEPAALESSAHVAAAALVRSRAALAAPAPRLAARPSAAAAAQMVAPTALTKAEREELKQALRHTLQQQKKAASPNSTTAEGKSQIVAALLCFFLGGLGIHDFYLGYVGKGILQIFLSLIVIGFILVIIDFVRILTGSLKPKGGDYEKKI